MAVETMNTWQRIEKERSGRFQETCLLRCLALRPRSEGRESKHQEKPEAMVCQAGVACIWALSKEMKTSQLATTQLARQRAATGGWEEVGRLATGLWVLLESPLSKGMA